MFVLEILQITDCRVPTNCREYVLNQHTVNCADVNIFLIRICTFRLEADNKWDKCEMNLYQIRKDTNCSLVKIYKTSKMLIDRSAKADQTNCNLTYFVIFGCLQISFLSAFQLQFVVNNGDKQHPLNCSVLFMDTVRTCFFKYRESTPCGEDRGKRDLTSLDQCDEDVRRYLEAWHLSRENLSESALILARAGLFDVSADQVKLMYICPRHRHQYGRFFRPLRSCQYPSHKGKVKSVKGRHVINLQMAKDILRLYGNIVPIGSRKYLFCSFYSCLATTFFNQYVQYRYF